MTTRDSDKVEQSFPASLSSTELEELRREMRRDGLWAKKEFRRRAQEAAEAELPLPLPIWISRGEADK